MAKTGPAPMLDLSDYVPPDDAGRFQLIRGLVKSGVGPAQAWTVIEVLERIAETGDDGLGSSEVARVRRSQLRRTLSRLGAPPWWGGRPNGDKGALLSSAEQKGRRRRRGRGDRGARRWYGPLDLLEAAA